MFKVITVNVFVWMILHYCRCELKMHNCSCSCPSMQHGAFVSEGRAAGALHRDLAGLPLHQHPSAVCTGALLRDGAQTGSLPQAAFLSSQTGPGLHCQMEGQCEFLFFIFYLTFI